MGIETLENNERTPSLVERRETVYEEFLDSLKSVSSLNEIEHKFRSATEELGALQVEAAQSEEDFSVVFKNGYEISELYQNIKQYYDAKADSVTVDSFTTDNKREKVTVALEETIGSLPEEVVAEVDRLVDLSLGEEEAA